MGWGRVPVPASGWPTAVSARRTPSPLAFPFGPPRSPSLCPLSGRVGAWTSRVFEPAGGSRRGFGAGRAKGPRLTGSVAPPHRPPRPALGPPRPPLGPMTPHLSSRPAPRPRLPLRGVAGGRPDAQRPVRVLRSEGSGGGLFARERAARQNRRGPGRPASRRLRSGSSPDPSREDPPNAPLGRPSDPSRQSPVSQAPP